MKPLESLPEEDLKCVGLRTPPERIVTSGEDFDLDGEYAVSSTFVNKFTDNG